MIESQSVLSAGCNDCDGTLHFTGRRTLPDTALSEPVEVGSPSLADDYIDCEIDLNDQEPARRFFGPHTREFDDRCRDAFWRSLITDKSRDPDAGDIVIAIMSLASISQCIFRADAKSLRKTWH